MKRTQPQYWTPKQWRKWSWREVWRDFFVTLMLCALGISVLVWHSRNFENNTKAMEDIKRCAEEEKVLPTKS